MKNTLFSIVVGVSLLTPSAYPLQPGPEEQKAMTPDAVLKDLMDGNARYVEGKSTNFNEQLSKRIDKATEGQFPKAYILSCVDSRVPVETVFDQSIGDIFVGRVAGNIENVEQLGSMEFASAVAGVKLIMVLGHEACGAVKGACDDVKLGNLTGLLTSIKPAILMVDGHEGKRNSKNAEFVHEVIHSNVKQTVEDIRARSSVIAQLEKEGKLKLVGACYSLKDGSVKLIE
jgi:carbonic anhydrase